MDLIKVEREYPCPSEGITLLLNPYDFELHFVNENQYIMAEEHTTKGNGRL